MRCKSWFLEVGTARGDLAVRVQLVMRRIKFATNVRVVDLGSNCIEVAYDWADIGPAHYEIDESDLLIHGLLVWKSQRHGNYNPLARGDEQGNSGSEDVLHAE